MTRSGLTLSILIAATALLCVAAPAIAQSVPASVPPRLELGIHIVKPGETLFQIAWRYDMTVEELANLNATLPAADVWPGRELWVPLKKAVNARAGDPAGAGVGQAAGGAARAGVGQAAGGAAGALAPGDQTDSAGSPGAGPGGNAAPDATGEVPAAARPAAPAAQAASPLGTTSSPSTITVQPGDTLFGISQRYGVSPDDVRRWNGLPTDGFLRAGESLVLAPGDAGAAPRRSRTGTARRYTVQPGDNLSAIAARFGSTVSLIMGTNGLEDDRIQVGQRLTIPDADSAQRAGRSANAGAKRIEIDVSEQRMYVWSGDELVWRFVVSTGISGYPTRRGTFAVQSKIPNAWSGPWQLWMPFWLGIYWAGSTENGIHALPIANGQRLWGGVLGTPISYGCIVLGTTEAELLFGWADLGTPVIIRD